jgi:hypothetical protein
VEGNSFKWPGNDFELRDWDYRADESSPGFPDFQRSQEGLTFQIKRVAAADL